MAGNSSSTEKIAVGLIRAGAMTRDQAKEVLRRQKKGDGRLFGEIAVEAGYLGIDKLVTYLNNVG